jgi:predicted flap endonuclease-1-like 5' DNA nuclease
MEDMCNEAAEKAKIEAAQRLLDMGVLTYEQIAQAQGLDIETVKDLATKNIH